MPPFVIIFVAVLLALVAFAILTWLVGIIVALLPMALFALLVYVAVFQIEWSGFLTWLAAMLFVGVIAIAMDRHERWSEWRLKRRMERERQLES